MLLSRVLIDTDVLIDYLRGYPQSVEYLEGLTDIPYVSALTVAELFAGVKGNKEKEKLESLIETFSVIELNRESARLGGLFLRDHGKSHGVGLADALIAATAKLHGLTLITLNIKHFPMLNNAFPPYWKK